MIKVLVCGGRDFDDGAWLFAFMDRFHENYGVTHLIHGNARGADLTAGMWAYKKGIEVTSYPADWGRWRQAGGPIRNRDMLLLGKPDIVIAFPGGSGTRDMVDISKRAGKTVIEATR